MIGPRKGWLRAGTADNEGGHETAEGRGDWILERFPEGEEEKRGK